MAELAPLGVEAKKETQVGLARVGNRWAAYFGLCRLSVRWLVCNLPQPAQQSSAAESAVA